MALGKTLDGRLAVGWAVAVAGLLTACSSSPGAFPPRSTTTTGVATSVTDAPTTTVAPGAGETTAPSSTIATVPTTTEATGGPLAGAVIVIDPGHNGANGAHPTEINRLVDAGGFQKACNTTGTAANGLTESRFNWDTALLVRTKLEAAGAHVVLTRDSDDGWGPCIDQRAATAKSAGADLLVSVHADGADAGASGFHVITPTAAGVVSAANSEASATLAADVRDAMVAAGFSPSTYLGVDGIDPRADLGTLNLAGVPAVMLESGNMHNASDFAELASAAGQQRIADALTAAVTAYLQ